jgi:hypothetical protein
LVLETDSDSSSENEVYFFDVDTGEDEFIWIAEPQVLQPNLRYELEVCVDRSGCYNFVFFDTYGDGLFQGGLSLKWDGVEVLNIAPYESLMRLATLGRVALLCTGMKCWDSVS